MKPSSKANHTPLKVTLVSRNYCFGGKRLHTGNGPLIEGKPMVGQVICFTHQTAQHICHCSSPDQIQVGTRTRIPKKGHDAAWKALRKHLGPLVEKRLKDLTATYIYTSQRAVPGRKVRNKHIQTLTRKTLPVTI